MFGACLPLAARRAPAFALMAGAYPDTPAARVDPNRPDSPWAGVGSITFSGGTYSGALIGRRFVLTAGHVAPVGPDVAKATFNLNLGPEATRIPIARAFKHPDYIGYNTPNLNDDIAVLELAHDAPPGVPVYGLADEPLAAGTVLTMVGYGASGNGSTGVSVDRDPTVKRVGQNCADAFVVDDEGSGANEIFLIDFDGEPGSLNEMGGKTLGNAVETTFASGDSGSPAFVREHGAWKIAGVNTFVKFLSPGATAMGRFGTGAGGQVVYAYRKWIQSVINAEEHSAPRR